MDISIVGIPSGDSECFCLLVDLETFRKIKREEPCEYDVGRQAEEGSPYRYMVYPNDIIVDQDRAFPDPPGDYYDRSIQDSKGKIWKRLPIEITIKSRFQL